MESYKLAKLIATNPDLDIIVMANAEGMLEKGSACVRKILKWESVPVDIIINFPYMETNYVFSEFELAYELRAGVRNDKVDIAKAIEELKPYWKNYIVIEAE